ncbi:uncharacterized protein LOC103519703 [Diaphorina citri]|uniref:Uncharacterized protein LOC103519703 n=1 Tax=Diaphorina citri TaxID=121845 RepID=A0A1S3DJH5_DIACI|nr:uncharacterized protein LOC103519703 [Diaphorina citri]
MSLANFQELGARKNTWKCINCKQNREVKKKTDDEEDDVTAKGTSNGGDQYGVLKGLFDDFKKTISDQIKDVENGLNFQSEQIADVLKNFGDMNTTFAKMQARQEEILKENQTLKNKVKKLEDKVLDLEQKYLDHNLEVMGVPETMTDESKIMEALCSVAKVAVPQRSRYTLKRSLVGPPGKPKAIIMSFESKYERDSILKACKKCKPKGLDLTKNATDVQPVYVNEQLTPQRKELFFKAMQIKREKKYLFLWVQEGKILLKKNENSRVVRIESIEDMN